MDTLVHFPQKCELFCSRKWANVLVLVAAEIVEDDDFARPQFGDNDRERGNSDRG
jgi:hypothetical protein